MARKYKITLLISIIILFLALFSASYAYLRVSSKQGSPNTISTLSCLNISITNTTSPIALTNDYPISDEEGLTRTPYVFQITNTCTGYVRANINLESLAVANNQLTRDYVRIAFNEVGSSDQTIMNLDSTTNTTATITNASSNNLRSLTLRPGQSKNYELRLWIDEDVTQSQGMNKSYSGKIVVVATVIPTPTSPEGWSEATSPSLLYYMKQIQATPNADDATGMTRPGIEASAGYGTYMSEGLRSAEDDYGTSYYYRGAQDNNYVIFAKMCWRIVRVDGAGNIKLVLYNYNSDKDDPTVNPCNVSGKDIAFARDDGGSIISTNFNSSNDKNAYVGLMYGTPGSTISGEITTAIQAYDAEHENITTHKSDILQALETWYSNNLVNYSSYLADVVWCNDKSVAEGNLGYNWETTWYGAGTRLYERTHEPTFKCPDASGTDKNLSRFTISSSSEGNKKLAYSIGLLTADEVAYAGAITNAAGEHYLKGNTGNGWWLMSPVIYNGSEARVNYLDSFGNIKNSKVNQAFRLRPAIALKSNTTVTSLPSGTSGTFGSATNPFVVD